MLVGWDYDRDNNIPSIIDVWDYDRDNNIPSIIDVWDYDRDNNIPSIIDVWDYDREYIVQRTSVLSLRHSFSCCCRV